MLIPTFIFLCIHLLSLQGVFSNLCESNDYSSPFAYYHKLVGTARSYDAWASKCTGILLTRSLSDINSHLGTFLIFIDLFSNKQFYSILLNSSRYLYKFDINQINFCSLYFTHPAAARGQNLDIFWLWPPLKHRRR